MTSRLNLSDRKLLYLLAGMDTVISYRDITEIVYKLKQRGVTFPYKFSEHKGSIHSRELDKALKKLVQLGYLKEIYLPGYRDYGLLYIRAYMITEKVKKILENPKFSTKDRKKIDKFIKKLKAEILERAR
ncbi:MAG: hypothetical protein DRJ49_04135 [Thermoprotei archaeon]|nr:MAG: hypothetical protein DRN53_08235 [Thermoprotei archaeon]RLE89026.1 MAG: hypothetical protein DRJ49_04135 [Thermoprotei archaeon]